MGIITECLMVLLLCQTICILADPMEQKDTPAGPQDLEEFDAMLEEKRFLTCYDSNAKKVKNGKKGTISNDQGTYECTCEDGQWPDASECTKLDKRGLETEEELAAQAFAAEIEKRGRGKGSCSKPKVVKDRTVKQLNQDYVKWHNYYRCLHGVGPVKYDTTLEATARRNVEMNVRGGGMVHTKNSRYGENLWAMWGGGFGIAAISGQNPVKSWYDEMKSPGYSFNRRNPTMFSYGTGHFTQVVWAATKKIGCWTAEHPYQGMTRVFVACNYDPAGNMNIRPKDKNVANWNKNVPPPI